MIHESRIGFFTPSLGLENAGECLEFVKARGGLIQAWTLAQDLAHEVKPGLDIETIVSEVNKSVITVSSLSGYMDWTEENGNELRRLEFERIISQCRECGCNIVCTEAGRHYESTEDKRAWKLLVDSMKCLCRKAEDNGVYIAVEMGPLDLISGAECFLELQQLVQSTRLKVNFDPANLVRGQRDPLITLRELKDDVVQVHLKDAVPEGQRPIGKGIVDFISLFEILETGFYKGNYIIEAEYKSENRAESVSKDYEKILNLIAQ